MQYPWRRYNDFPVIPDYVDTEGRHYAHASKEVMAQFQEKDQRTFEIKLPKGKGLEFPERNVTLMKWVNKHDIETYRVASCFFRPRGATGVSNIYKEANA